MMDGECGYAFIIHHSSLIIEPQHKTTMLTFITGCHALSLPALAASQPGAYFGEQEHMLPAAPEAPTGYFQSVLVERVNEAILRDNRIAWNTPATCCMASQATQLDLAACLDAFLTHDKPVMVDPRFEQTLPVWLAECRARGIAFTILRPDDTRAAMIGALTARRNLALPLAAALADFYLQNKKSVGSVGSVGSVESAPPAPTPMKTKNRKPKTSARVNPPGQRICMDCD